jgi:hypothetical protein
MFEIRSREKTYCLVWDDNPRGPRYGSFASEEEAERERGELNSLVRQVGASFRVAPSLWQPHSGEAFLCIGSVLIGTGHGACAIDSQFPFELPSEPLPSRDYGFVMNLVGSLAFTGSEGTRCLRFAAPSSASPSGLIVGLKEAIRKHGLRVDVRDVGHEVRLGAGEVLFDGFPGLALAARFAVELDAVAWKGVDREAAPSRYQRPPPV